jgi:anion-transporting  ArsA/GET3 family ATPase
MIAEPRLRIVTGKGGVGKTTVAAAIALAEARSGRRVLLAEMNGRDAAARLLEVPATGSTMQEVLSNLWLVDMNPRDALREYVLLTFRFETIYKAVFENRFVRHFLRLVPSLAELNMLGKIWFHEREKLETDDTQPRFDVIVLDAPATGHAISSLRAAEVVRGTVPPGPLRDTARDIHELLTDPLKTVLHVVTTPEEMPVNEAVELERAANDSLHMAVGATFINQRLAPLTHARAAGTGDAAVDGVLAGLKPGPLAALADVLTVREQRRRLGEQNLERLPHHMLSRSISLPRLVTAEFGRAAIDALVDRLLADAAWREPGIAPTGRGGR